MGRGRDYVIPDDVKVLAPPTLRHRLVLAPGAEIEGLDADKIVAQILEQVQAAVEAALGGEPTALGRGDTFVRRSTTSVTALIA